MMVRRISFALCALLALPAAAQNDEAPAPDAAAAAEAVGGEPTEVAEPPRATVSVRVAVRRATGPDASEPVAGVRVRAHVIAQPHDVVRSLDGRTDVEGIATFEVDAAPGLELVAEAQTDRRHFSDPVDLASAGERTIDIRLLGTTTDPSVVRAESVHTIIEPWEGYVTVTQAFNLTTTGDVVYAAERAEDGRPNLATLLMIPLPNTAEGIRIVRPEGQARASGTIVSTTMEVHPRQPRDRRGADVVLQYSIKTEDRSEVAFDVPVSMDVDVFTVVVPRETTLRRHPVIDVEIVAPDCADPTTVCLQPYDGDRSGVPLRQDVDLTMVQGQASRGQTARIVTRGWPSRSRWERPVAAGAAGLAFVVAIGLFARDHRRRRTDPRELRHMALEAQRDALMESAAEMERRLDDGLMLRRDYDVAIERIRQQLGVIYRRLRELDAGKGTSPEA